MTKLALWNLALDEIGQKPLATELDSVPAALVLARQWEITLRTWLKACKWWFATKDEELTAASPVPDFGWSTRFELPADFVTLVSLNETYVDEPSDLFELKDGCIYTDEDEAQIEYVYEPSESNIDSFLDTADPLAVAALATLLASRIATQLAQDSGTMKMALLEEYERMRLPAARASNARANKKPTATPDRDSNWVRARYTSTAD
jgi:hypothetical protein